MKIWKISFWILLDFLQIDDFLLGRLPLTLSLGAGAHTMYVQLQLSQKVRELQENTDSLVETRCKPQTAQMNNVNLFGSSLGFSSSQTSSLSLLPTHSSSSLQCSTQRPRASFSSSTGVASESFINPSSARCSQSECTPPSPSETSHPYSLPHAATPVCSSKPTCSEPGHLSPAPASTFIEVSDVTCFPLTIIITNRKHVTSTFVSL